jgi:hypothetical protein
MIVTHINSAPKMQLKLVLLKAAVPAILKVVVMFTIIIPAYNLQLRLVAWNSSALIFCAVIMTCTLPAATKPVEYIIICSLMVVTLSGMDMIRIINSVPSLQQKVVALKAKDVAMVIETTPTFKLQRRLVIWNVIAPIFCTVIMIVALSSTICRISIAKRIRCLTAKSAATLGWSNICICTIL